jgi:hypothetical protein
MFPAFVRFARPIRTVRPAWFGRLTAESSTALAVVREWTAPRFAAVALLIGAIVLSPASQAFVAPAAGSFGYDIYDTVVNQILGGPIGFVGGVFLIVWGATQLMRNWVMTIACVIAGTVLIKAPAILTSLGALAD